MAQIKRSVRPVYLSVFAFIFLCLSPYCQSFILPQQDQQCIWHTQSLQIIQLSLLCHKNSNQPTTYTAKTHLFSICPLTEAEVSKLLLSSHPTTCPLDPIPSHLPHCIQAGSGYPTVQKTYIKHFSYRKLQTCLSPSNHSEKAWTSRFQPVILISVKY